MSQDFKNFKFQESHEWAVLEGDIVTIGISDYAQHSMGDVVFLDLEPVGTKVKKGNSFGAVESVKAASDLFSPVSGEIIEVNEALTSEPELLNSAPYETFLVKIKITNPKDLDDLMDFSAYEAFIKE